MVRGGGTKPRPPSVALCAVIGEPSKGDCTTDGHLQATMSPFVQPLPSALNMKLVGIIQSFTFPIDSGLLMPEWPGGDAAAGVLRRIVGIVPPRLFCVM